MQHVNDFFASVFTREGDGELPKFSKEVENICQPLLTVPNDIVITAEDVKKVFTRVNPHKTSGPDGVGGKVLKECSSQLCIVFTRLFQFLLNSHYVPRSWRTSTIIPIAKRTNAKEMNDYRPVALTSVVCKCTERILCNKLTSSVADRLDPLQFAYKAKRGVEDATLTLTNKALNHLDKPGTFVRVLMMDFSSAFNTLQTHILIKRLLDLDVSPGLILWIRSFLSDRPQESALIVFCLMIFFKILERPRAVSCRRFYSQFIQMN